MRRRSRIVQDFFQLFAQGEGKIRLNGLLGGGEGGEGVGKYVSMCKVCGKLGGFEGMLPRDFGPSDAIWWNQGLFSHKNILSFFVSLKLFEGLN